jgi:hypothetical protein
MKVRTYNGVTECRFEDFAKAEPLVVDIRERYRAGKVDKDQVVKACTKLFGFDRLNKEWRQGWTLKDWDAHVDAQPIIYRKLFYHPDVVSECVTGEDE